MKPALETNINVLFLPREELKPDAKLRNRPENAEDFSKVPSQLQRPSEPKPSSSAASAPEHSDGWSTTSPPPVHFKPPAAGVDPWWGRSSAAFPPVNIRGSAAELRFLSAGFGVCPGGVARPSPARGDPRAFTSRHVPWVENSALFDEAALQQGGIRK